MPGMKVVNVLFQDHLCLQVKEKRRATETSSEANGRPEVHCMIA